MKTNNNEFSKLLERVISLKDNLYGVGNWDKKRLPTTSEDCISYIRYCKREFHIIG